MTTKTARKPKTGAGDGLSRGAEAVRRHLAETGDSIAAQIAGPDLYWSFTKSGLPVRGRDVRELKAAGMIFSFGGEIDPDGPAACYVLAGDAPPALACGSESLDACEGRICLSCAPREMVERIRSGENHLPKIWIGPRP